MSFNYIIRKFRKEGAFEVLFANDGQEMRRFSHSFSDVNARSEPMPITHTYITKPRRASKLRPELLPVIPKEFEYLYQFEAPEENYLGKFCDCSGAIKPIEQCPHLEDENLRDYLLSLPQRLMILEKDPDMVERGKEIILKKLIDRLNHHPWCTCSEAEPQKKVAPHPYEHLKDDAIEYDTTTPGNNVTESGQTGISEAQNEASKKNSTSLPESSFVVEHRATDELHEPTIKEITGRDVLLSEKLKHKADVDQNEDSQPQLLSNTIPTTHSLRLCHLYKDVFKLLEINPKEIIVDNVINTNYSFKKPESHAKFANFVINTSFCSNILLLILKIVAFALSLSMSVMASMIDSALDILSGLVLFVAIKVASKGISQGKFQEEIHQPKGIAKFIYANRFDSLGVLAFSAIMATLALVLVYESVMSIISMTKSDYVFDVTFDIIPMVIMIFTICLKFVLCILAHIASKNGEKVSVLEAYRDDHRNDVATNAISFVGVMLATKIPSVPKMCYFDPCTSLCFCLFICYNWIISGLEEISNIAGKRLGNDDLAPFYVKLLTLFLSTTRITEIRDIFAYTQGSHVVLEVTLIVPDGMRVHEIHDIAQVIETEMERYANVERCFVHVESSECTNLFEDNCEPW